MAAGGKRLFRSAAAHGPLPLAVPGRSPAATALLPSSTGPCSRCPLGAGSNVGNREAGCQGRAAEPGGENSGSIPGARGEARPGRRRGRGAAAHPRGSGLRAAEPGGERPAIALAYWARESCRG